MALVASVDSSIQFRPVRRFVDGFENDFRPRKDVVVPEAQYAKSIRSEKGITPDDIVRLLGMLASIQLHKDMLFEADKITDVRSDGVLTAELEARQLPPPQVVPKQALGIGRIFAEVASVAKHPSMGSRSVDINVAWLAT